MPSKKKNKSKSKTAGPKKDDLAGLEELLNDATAVQEIEKVVAEQHEEHKRSGVENARLGMAGFKQASNNPAMFSEAMEMLADPAAVKQAEAMMNDPAFKQEIQRYMASLQTDPSFREAMKNAQQQFNSMLKNPSQADPTKGKFGTLAAKADSAEQTKTADSATAGAQSPAAAHTDVTAEGTPSAKTSASVASDSVNSKSVSNGSMSAASDGTSNSAEKQRPTDASVAAAGEPVVDDAEAI